MLSTVDELKLIARCIATDDRNAFGKLVDAYQDSLRRYLLNLTLGDACLTDDLAQETFIKAWSSIRSFKGIAKFRTWLFRIAWNEYVSFRRRERPTVDLDTPGINIMDIDRHSAAEASMDIQVALKTLSPKERTVVLLFYLEGMPIKKVVEITGIPEGSVKVYLKRAREKMAVALSN